jgi:hypothetical protein
VVLIRPAAQRRSNSSLSTVPTRLAEFLPDSSLHTAGRVGRSIPFFIAAARSPGGGTSCFLTFAGRSKTSPQDLAGKNFDGFA